MLLLATYLCMFASSVAIVEPSPHDALVLLVALCCLITGARLDRLILVLLLLLLLWNVGGLFSLMEVVGRDKTTEYAATSIYLAIAAIVWAMLFAQNTMPRITVLQSAYVLTAFLSAIAGICGYLNLFPKAHDLFAWNERAVGLFKDPNVYAPFLIWPTLIVFERLLVRRITLVDTAVLGTLLVALLVAFSRGAWVHLGISGVVVIVLALLTASQGKTRFRIVLLSCIALAVLAVMVVALLSIPAISSMVAERAHLINSYDVGDGGRFRLQELALRDMFDHPNGMGPFGFASTQTNQQHNVYLQAMLVYGWAGGAVYVLMILMTFKLGLKAVFVRTPWQPYLITAIGAFTGEVLEGFIIDTDHWRHYFLLLGVIWGLCVATSKVMRERAPRPA